MARFTGLNAQVLGISVDHIPCLQAWAESLGGIHYPLLSDFWPHGEVARRYGVFREVGSSERAVFVIDGSGVIRYASVYDIDKQPDNQELIQALERIEPRLAASPANEKPADALPHGGIVLYCTSWCPDCRRARTWLNARGLAYTEIDIDQNTAASRQVREWGKGFRITPTFDIDGVIIQNFNEEKLSEVLKERINS